MCFSDYFCLIKVSWNKLCFFVVWLYYFITRHWWIFHYICEMFSIFAQSFLQFSLDVSIIFFTCMKFFTLTLTFLVIHHWSEQHFLSSTLHLYSQDICFVHIFDSFISVIMLNTLRFKSSVLLEKHTLLDKQLPPHLPNSTANEY